MEARVGLDPGDVIEINIGKISEKIDDILHEDITNRIGQTVDHLEIELFVIGIVEEHNNHENSMDKVMGTMVYCPYCLSQVYWRVRVNFGFYCKKCGLVWQKPLDRYELKQKIREQESKPKKSRLIRFKEKIFS